MTMAVMDWNWPSWKLGSPSYMWWPWLVASRITVRHSGNLPEWSSELVRAAGITQCQARHTKQQKQET